MKFFRLALLILSLLVPVQAQELAQDAIGGPVLGYFWDVPISRVRPVLGIPGSSLIGEPLDLGIPLSAAEISPRQRYMLAVRADSGEIVVAGLDPGRLGVRTIPEAGPGADRILISPSGASAALYSRGRKELQLIAGLPDSPALRARIDLSGIPELLTALAVADSGDLALAASGGDEGGLYVLTPDSGARRILAAARTQAVAFLEDSSDALVALEDRNELLRIDDPAGAARVLLVAGEREGVSRPVAVAGSGRRVFVANAGSNSAGVVDLDSGNVTNVPCPCRVSTLHRLRGDAVFRLNAASDAPIYVLEADPRENRLWFVPAESGSRGTDAASGRLPRGRSR